MSSLMFRSSESAYALDSCPQQPPENPTRQGRYGTLETLQALQYVGFIGGGVLAAASAVLFATAPNARGVPTPGVAVTADGASLSLRGRF